MDDDTSTGRVKEPTGFASSSRPTDPDQPIAGSEAPPFASAYATTAPKQTFCYACGTTIDPRAQMCTNCGVNQHHNNTTGQAHPQAVLGLILNVFFPGVGTLVLGQVTTGVIQFALWLVSIPLTFIIIGLPLYFGVWVWAIIIGVQALSNPRPQQANPLVMVRGKLVPGRPYRHRIRSPASGDPTKLAEGITWCCGGRLVNRTGWERRSRLGNAARVVSMTVLLAGCTVGNPFDAVSGGSRNSAGPAKPRASNSATPGSSAISTHGAGARITFVCPTGLTSFDLCAIDGAGQQRRTLVSNRAASVDGGELSPDGSKLVIWDGAAANYRIRLAGGDGFNPVDLGAGAEPSWSPDGQHLVYTCSAGPRTGCSASKAGKGGGIWVMKAAPSKAQTEPRQVSAFGGAGRWSPDGKLIVFSVGPGGPKQAGIYTVPQQGGTASMIVKGGGDAAWSPDGTHIAFTASPAGPYSASGTSVADADGQHGRPLDMPTQTYDSSPSWAPDGASVLVERNQLQGHDRSFIALNANGTGEREVLAFSPPDNGYSPRWGGGQPIDADVDHDGIDDALEQSLAERYAPVMFMEPGESNYPVNVPWLLQRMHLIYAEDGCGDKTQDLPFPAPVIGNQQALIAGADGVAWSHPSSFSSFPGAKTSLCGDRKAIPLSVVEGHPQQGDGDNGVGNMQRWALGYNNDSSGTDTSSVQLGSLDPRDWVTYFHAYPTQSGGIMIQYWHVFAGNTLDRDNHEGDWDASVQVELAADQTLRRAWFSRHNDDHPGTPYDANSLALFRGTHLEYTVDGGGHAAYASPGDWCVNPNTPQNAFHGSIVWPQNPSDPTATTLAHQNTDLHLLPGGGCFKEPDSGVGGTVWQTWTGGSVTQAGQVDHRIMGDQRGGMTTSQHGGLVNLGECNPSGLKAPVPGGACYPLNGNDFIRYSGTWGTTRHDYWSLQVRSPRGPVFQGWHEERYTSWYNQAATAPARQASAAPSTGLSVRP